MSWAMATWGQPLSPNGSAVRMRRHRARQRLAHVTGMLRLRPMGAMLPRRVLEAWAMRGLRLAPTEAQVTLLAPLVREPTGGAAAAAIAAMDGVPPVGSTYALVRSMVDAARAAIRNMRETLHRTPELHTPRMDDAEASTRDTAGPVADVGPPARRSPIGLAAWRALREPGGALHRGPTDQLPDVAAERMARQRVYMRDVRPPRRGPLP